MTANELIYLLVGAALALGGQLVLQLHVVPRVERESGARTAGSGTSGNSAKCSQTSYRTERSCVSAMLVAVGTDAWRNWNAFNGEKPETENADDELYSDRHFIGGPSTHGPYALAAVLGLPQPRRRQGSDQRSGGTSASTRTSSQMS